LNLSSVQQIAIFASGNGSNAEAIIKYFQNNTEIKVALVVCNNPNAGVTEIAQLYNVPLQIISNDTLAHPEIILEQLEKFKINWIVLAGFLRKIPDAIIRKFHNRIINIHPALLPKFGGKGMYGDKVHEAVLLNREKETGITIHLVNEHYDEGQIIFQERFDIAEDDTLETVRNKIRQLEHRHFPRVIQQFIHNLTVTG
jgi:phosphoribosylglycinamide formyltransferase-1